MKNSSENFGTPEGWSGKDVAIDEMNPQFNLDGTVDLHMYSRHETLTEGEIIQLRSNKHPEQSGMAKILKIDGNVVKAQLFD